jgi:hypothetical protein
MSEILGESVANRVKKRAEGRRDSFIVGGTDPDTAAKQAVGEALYERSLNEADVKESELNISTSREIAVELAGLSRDGLTIIVDEFKKGDWATHVNFEDPRAIRILSQAKRVLRDS